MRRATGERGVALVDIAGKTYRRFVADNIIDAAEAGLAQEAAEQSISYTVPLEFERALSKERQNIEHSTKSRIELARAEGALKISITARGHEAQRAKALLSQAEHAALVANPKLVRAHHALAIPVAFPATERKLEELKERRLAVDPDSFVSPQALYISLVKLNLYSDDRIARAKALLSELRPKLYDLLETRSLLVKLQGLEAAKGMPRDCKALMIKTIPTSAKDKRFDRIARFVCNAFANAGLASGLIDEDKLKVRRAFIRYANVHSLA
jgi:hypothetical protein